MRNRVKLRLKIHEFRHVAPGTELHFDDGIHLLVGDRQVLAPDRLQPAVHRRPRAHVWISGVAARYGGSTARGSA
jgi:hypothetical protein